MDYETPLEGEPVHYDGRMFFLTEINGRESLRGWWWRAVSLDRKSLLQGNLKLRRIGLTDGWQA